MSISDEFSRLQALHESGTLTDAEFTEAKAKVLAEEQPQIAAQTRAAQQDIRRLQIQNEIQRLDQDWALEREDYMLRGSYGRSYVATVGNTIVPALAMIVLGLFLFASAYPAGEKPNSLPYIGLISLIVGVLYAINGSIKAKAYEAAEERYEQQRRELTDHLAALG